MRLHKRSIRAPQGSIRSPDFLKALKAYISFKGNTWFIRFYKGLLGAIEIYKGEDLGRGCFGGFWKGFKAIGGPLKALGPS